MVEMVDEIVVSNGRTCGKELLNHVKRNCYVVLYDII
jgi:hypothetical protein